MKIWHIRIVAIALSVCLANLVCHKARAETIKVGVLAGFSSILSEEATQLKNGVQLAAAAIAKDSSKKFKISTVEKDTQLNPDLAVQNFNELTQGFENIKFFIGPQSSKEVIKTAPFAKKAQAVLISPTARTDDLAVLNEYVFRTRHSQQQESKFFAPYILRETKGKPLHTLILDSHAGYAFVEVFRQEYKKIGGNFGVFEDLLIDRPNYSQVMHKLEINRAAYALVIGLGVHVADVMLEAADAGLNLRFFGTSASSNKLIIERAGKLAEGFTFPYAFDPENDPNSASFAVAYRTEFGATATDAAANAYDAMMLLSMCFEKVGNSAEAVKSCLFYVRDYPGAGGPLSMQRNGGCKRELHIRMVKDGKFVTIRDEETS